MLSLKPKHVVLGSLFLLIGLGMAWSLAQKPWSQADAKTLVSFATAIGRASACGLSTANEEKLVSAWITRHFQPFPEQFDALYQHTRAVQKDLQLTSPVESCDSVKSAYATVAWDLVKPWWTL